MIVLVDQFDNSSKWPLSPWKLVVSFRCQRSSARWIILLAAENGCSEGGCGTPILPQDDGAAPSVAVAHSL